MRLQAATLCIRAATLCLHAAAPRVQVASHNEPDEYELSVAFDNEPEAGSEAAATLVNLFGPLRPAAARAAEGKLTRQLWAQVDAFREEFMRL